MRWRSTKPWQSVSRCYPWCEFSAGVIDIKQKLLAAPEKVRQGRIAQLKAVGGLGTCGCCFDDELLPEEMPNEVRVGNGGTGGVRLARPVSHFLIFFVQIGRSLVYARNDVGGTKNDKSQEVPSKNSLCPRSIMCEMLPKIENPDRNKVQFPFLWSHTVQAAATLFQTWSSNLQRILGFNLIREVVFYVRWSHIWFSRLADAPHSLARARNKEDHI